MKKAYILANWKAIVDVYRNHPQTYPTCVTAYCEDNATTENEKLFATEEEAQKELEPHREESTCRLYPTQIKGKYEAMVSCWVIEEVFYNDDDNEEFTLKNVMDSADSFDLVDSSDYPPNFSIKF